MSEAGVCADGSLGNELAAILDPTLQDALNHPTRREILRVLHSDEQPRSVTEILGKLSRATPPEVSYHVRVLQAAGSVVADGTTSEQHGRDVLYRSALASDPGALAALAVTEQLDRTRRHGVRRAGSNFLSMFRVPRPDRAIRLGRRDDQRGESRS